MATWLFAFSHGFHRCVFADAPNGTASTDNALDLLQCTPTSACGSGSTLRAATSPLPDNFDDTYDDRLLSSIAAGLADWDDESSGSGYDETVGPAAAALKLTSVPKLPLPPIVTPPQATSPSSSLTPAKASRKRPRARSNSGSSVRTPAAGRFRQPHPEAGHSGGASAFLSRFTHLCSDRLADIALAVFELGKRRPATDQAMHNLVAAAMLECNTSPKYVLRKWAYTAIDGAVVGDVAPVSIALAECAGMTFASRADARRHIAHALMKMTDEECPKVDENRLTLDSSMDMLLRMHTTFKSRFGIRIAYSRDVI